MEDFGGSMVPHCDATASARARRCRCRTVSCTSAADIAFEDRLADEYEGGGEIHSFVMVVTDERSTSATFGVVGRSSPVIGQLGGNDSMEPSVM